MIKNKKIFVFNSININFAAMDVLYILIVVSLSVALFFLGLFIYSVKSGQYDDDYTPSVRMLFDDELLANKKGSKSSAKKKISKI